MKLCSYVHRGAASYGIFTDSGIIDLGSRLGATHATLVELLRQDGLGAAREAAAGGAPDTPLEEIEFLPLTLEPVNVICQGLNYRSHLEELGRSPAPYPGGFLRTRQSLVGHLQPLAMPAVSSHFDFEGEYSIVIGRRCHRVSRDEAMNYIAGYTILMDGSVRDFQRRNIFQGKNFWRSGALGPCMVTRDAAPRWPETRLETRLNGRTMQSATIDELIHDVPALVSYYSQLIEMQPGDVIATGTAGGVGHSRDPEVYMRPGDVIEVEISGIGTLRNDVR